jgi:hypothetical protein
LVNVLFQIFNQLRSSLRCGTRKEHINANDSNREITIRGSAVFLAAAMRSEQKSRTSEFN